MHQFYVKLLDFDNIDKHTVVVVNTIILMIVYSQHYHHSVLRFAQNFPLGLVFMMDGFVCLISITHLALMSTARLH